jgi:hypothetical protein
VTENDPEAVKWYQKSANQDYAKAQYQLGKCYLNGEGIAKDETKAKTWLKKAVRNKKDGDEIKDKIRKNAAEGKEDAKRMLTLL